MRNRRHRIPPAPLPLEAFPEPTRAEIAALRDAEKRICAHGLRNDERLRLELIAEELGTAPGIVALGEAMTRLDARRRAEAA